MRSIIILITMPNRAWPAAIVPFQVEMLKRTSNKQSQSKQRTCWLSPHTRILEYQKKKHHHSPMSVRQKGKFELLKSNIVTIYMFIFCGREGGNYSSWKLGNVQIVRKFILFARFEKFGMWIEKNVNISRWKILNCLGKCFVHNNIPGSRYLIYIYDCNCLRSCDYVKSLLQITYVLILCASYPFYKTLLTNQTNQKFLSARKLKYILYFPSFYTFLKIKDEFLIRKIG